MNKQPLNHANLTRTLVSFLAKLGQNRETVVLSVLRSGWKVGFTKATNAVDYSITSADVSSKSYTVAERLLAGLEN